MALIQSRIIIWPASPNLWLGSALLLGSGVMRHKIGSIRFTAYRMNAGIRWIGADFALIFSTTGPIATRS